MLPDRFQRLRRVQFSTILACYSMDNPSGVPADFWKFPDDREQWPAACGVLASLEHLQYAHISIFLLCLRQGHRHRHATDTELLYQILQPLTAVSASDFTVEVACPLDAVRKRLGQTPYRLLEREYPVCSSLAFITISADSLAGSALSRALMLNNLYGSYRRALYSIQRQPTQQLQYVLSDATTPQTPSTAVLTARSARTLVIKPSNAAGVCLY
jgi:hypothetical protein